MGTEMHVSMVMAQICHRNVCVTCDGTGLSTQMHVSLAMAQT